MSLRFVAAPSGLAPDVLGVVVHRAAAPAMLPLPAHALAIFTVVLQGSLRCGAHTLQAGQTAVQGSATAARMHHASADLVCASVLCRASVLPRLTGQPAHLFTDVMLPDQALAAAPPLERCAGWVAAGAAGDEPLALELLAWIAGGLAAARAPTSHARRFAATLADWQPMRPGTTVLPVPTGWSERGWQRACREELGVSPKFLQRLARLHASIRQQGGGAPRPWAEHAVDAGFSDQAHLARDYRTLSGQAPVRGLAAGRASEPLRLSAATLAPRFFSA